MIKRNDASGLLSERVDGVKPYSTFSLSFVRLWVAQKLPSPWNLCLDRASADFSEPPQLLQIFLCSIIT